MTRLVHSRRAWARGGGSGGPVYVKLAVSRVVAWRIRPSWLAAKPGARCIFQKGDRNRARIIAGCVVVDVAR
jgi:hypothetical protein